MPVSSAVGVAQSGKISWFGGPGDPSSGPTTSSGAPVSYPGISTYNQATKGGYWLVKMPNGKQAVLKQTDIGPAPWTGRNFDFTYTALPLLGYSQGNFPTDAQITGTYLGKSVPSQYQHLVIGGGGQASSVPGPSVSGSSSGSSLAPVGMPTATTQFDQAGYQKAVNASIAGSFLKSNAKSPYDVGAPKTGITASAGLAPLFSAGLTTKAPNPADYTSTVFKQAQNTLQKLAGGTPLNQHPAAFSGSVNGSGYTNPLPGGHYTRTDMGVDAGMTDGAPIKALGNMKYIGTNQNWYAGQPYLLFQLLDGPQAGKYVYYAEAIRPNNFQQGQVIAKGATIGTFNGGGTGLELGWGSSVPGRTLAQEQGNTGSSTHELSPSGISFRNFLNGIGAKAGANY